MTSISNLSFVIPAKNEALGLKTILPNLSALYPNAEIIVVNDASTDETADVAKRFGCRLVNQPYSKGNGAAIKCGLRAASGEFVVCMDADGQHQPKDVKILIEKLAQGYDMVVGARSRAGQAGAHRSIANRFYNKFASWMVSHKVEDLTSGFRVLRREKFLEFISLLPNKFSYPTTITMSFFRAGYSVAYVPIDVIGRVEGSKSHINAWRDGVRFLLIIFKIGTLFSPLKLFAPVSLGLFLSGFGYYLYTYITDGRFTNMGVLLFTTAIVVFLMGLVSEQVTTLYYKDKN